MAQFDPITFPSLTCKLYLGLKGSLTLVSKKEFAKNKNLYVGLNAGCNKAGGFGRSLSFTGPSRHLSAHICVIYTWIFPQWGTKAVSHLPLCPHSIQ